MVPIVLPVAKEDIRLSTSVLWQWEQTGSSPLSMDLTKNDDSLEQELQRYSYIGTGVSREGSRLKWK